MPFIITDPCIETKDAACVDVCPVDCIHPRKDEAEFAEATMLYIHPEECIDCGACVPAPRGGDSRASTRAPHQRTWEANAALNRRTWLAGDRQSARGCPRRHHGCPGGRASGRPRAVLTLELQMADCRLQINSRLD
jgi:NAD-dependent dihydropyrimidine dehydrogenase PreA subunit